MGKLVFMVLTFYIVVITSYAPICKNIRVELPCICWLCCMWYQCGVVVYLILCVVG